jgi:hypothetical protein
LRQPAEKTETTREAMMPALWMLVASMWIGVLAPPYPEKPPPNGIAALRAGTIDSYRSVTSRLPRFVFVEQAPSAADLAVVHQVNEFPDAAEPHAPVPRVGRTSLLAVLSLSLRARAPPA